MYLFRAVDAHGQTVDFYLSETRDREAAKIFLQKALANPDNRPPHVFATDGLRSYPSANHGAGWNGHRRNWLTPSISTVRERPTTEP